MRTMQAKQGMTLLELVIYIGVASIALGGIIGLFVLLNQSWSRTRSQSIVDEGLRAAAERLQTEAAAADTVLEPAYRAAVLDDSPIGYWRLDETGLPTARNSSLNGQTLDATYWPTGGFSFDQQSVISDVNSAVRFPGLSNSYAYKNPASPGLVGDAAFTIEAWVNPAATRADGMVFSYGAAAANRVVSLGSDGSGRIYSVHYSNDHPFTATWTLGQWQYVVLTYDPATSTESLYVNGAFQESWTPANLALQNGDDIFIGRATWNGIYMAEAVVDEVALYNRALSSAEITDHYRHGIGAQLAFNRGTTAPAIYSGYAWSENFGWISWNCASQQEPWDCVQGDALFDNYRVTRALDNLSGFAKTEHTGFLSLNCASSPTTDACNTSNYRVSAGSDGEYRGWGWGDGLGWVSFNCENTNNCSSSAGDWKVFETATPTGAELHGWAWSEVWGWISFNCADRGAGVCTASPYRVSRGTSGEQVRFAIANGVLTAAAGGETPQNLTDPAVNIALCDNETRFFTVVANPPPARPSIRLCMKASYRGTGAAAAGYSNTLRLTLELR